MVPENTSISKADALAEAYKRGLLPPDKKAAYEEAMKRGLVQPVATPPNPAPMSQPDATPWGDGQAFDDMYARKPQTDPMNLPLMPGARTLTSGQPTRMKPPPAPRGPVMSPAQRQATQPARDAAVAKRTEQANRWKTDSPFGTPVDEMGMPIAVTDAQRDGGMYGVRDDVGKGIVASPIHAERAVVGATESILNLPADVYNEVQRANARHVLTPQEEMRNVNRMPQLMGQVGVQKAPPVQVPRFDFSAAKIPVPQELESVSGALGEGLAQFLISRKLVGTAAPGGGMAANLGKDAGAVFVGIDGSSGRLADIIPADAIPEGPLRDYFNYLKTQPDDSPLLGRFKNFLEDMTVSGPMIVPQAVIAPTARAVGNAINPTLTPTNAGGVAARAGVPRPQPAPPQAPPVQPAAQAGSAVDDVDRARFESWADKATFTELYRALDNAAEIEAKGGLPDDIAFAKARAEAAQRAIDAENAKRVAEGLAPRVRTAQQAPTQPLTATAPPVPPISPNAPAVTVGAPQPVPARSRAEQRADDLLIKKLAADGITMDDVRKIQARLARRGDSGVYETIGEIAALTDKSSGANLRGLQMAGGAAPGPLQEALVGLVNQNTEKLSPRLSRGATRATGQKADNAVATLDELENRLRTEATPAYDDAYATPVNPQVFANEILPVLNTPSGQKALQAARNNLASIAADLQGRAARGASERATMESQRAQAAVKSIDDFMADPVRGTAIPTTMALDYTKRAFDDVIADAGFGSDTARIVGGTKRNFADSVSQATGGQYGNALGVFEDVKRLEDAFEVGTQALNKKTWELERELAKGRGGSPWTAGEVEALAMGVARNIEDLIEANNQSALTKLLKDKALKNMATALGSQKAADMFEETIRRLGANREWGRRVAGGSDTAMRQAAIRDAGMEGEDAITRVLDRVETSGNQFSLPGLVNDVAVKPIARTAKDIYQRLRYPGVYDEEVNRALIPLIGKPMTEGNLNEVIRRVEARMAEKGLIPPVQPAAVAAPPPAPRSRPRGPRGNPPGTTSSASATGTGIVAGGVLGAMAPADDENEQFINALFTAAGVGTAAGVAAKLAKGGKPPPASGKGAKPKAPPAPGFDQRFMKEAQRLVSYNGGVDKALKAQQYVIDQLKNSKAPNAQDRINRAVSVQYAIRRMADRSNRELDEIAATAPRSGPPGVKPPPVRNGMPGNSRGIADNLKQDALLAGFGSVGGSFANQDDPQAGALGGMGIALGAKYVPRAVNAMRGAGRVKPPPVRGADQAGFGSGKAESRPKPPPKGQTGNALAGKPPKGPPGTLSRMVAGGAVGGIAGGVAGEAGGQEEDLTAEMNNTKKDIDDLNAALKTWDSLDVMGKQRLLIQLGRVQSTYVDKNGARRKFDDGTTGDRTEPLFKAYAQEKRDALEKAEAGLEALKKQSAYRQFQKEQNPFFDAVRELGPSGAMALAGAAATVLRIRGVGKSKAAVKVIEKDINDLLTNGPVKSLLKKGGAANTERNRAVNMNEFYRQGGAPDSKLPFNYGAAGYKPNPKAAKPGSLYSSKTTTKMDGVGSQFLRPNDIKVLGVGLLDSVAIMPFVSGAEEELKKAKEDVDNGNDSIEALRRVEKAKTDLAMYQTIQRIGWGLAGGGALGAAYRYKLPKPDIRGAEEEVAAIGGYLRSIAPPKTPRAPKALAPPATPQTPPVAGPPAQLLLPAPSPPLKKPKPKPKPKPKKP